MSEGLFAWSKTIVAPAVHALASIAAVVIGGLWREERLEELDEALMQDFAADMDGVNVETKKPPGDQARGQL